jgi:CelD/BcsL family acetyltransferase involved in cellulose biosynthesis
MGQLHLQQLESVDQIRRLASRWDDLWARSEVSLPTVRAELVAGWVEHFAPDARLRVLVVEEGDRLVGAIPLIGRRVRGVVPVGDVTWNYWSPNGELLVDPAVAHEALEMLAEAIERLPWPLVWLETVPLSSDRWQGLLAVLARRGLAYDAHVRYHIGQVEIARDFAEHESRLSGNHRRLLRKRLARLESVGPVELRTHVDPDPDELECLLRAAFEIEDRSWKGREGSSVLSTPGMFEFYFHQACRLAQWGHLRLSFLDCDRQPIAFEFGWTAKGVYHMYKMGYDESFGRYSPGNLLRMLAIRAFCERREPRIVDFQGPRTEAFARWSTRSYPIARLVISPRRLGSRALLAGYRALAGVVRTLRRTAAT